MNFLHSEVTIRRGQSIVVKLDRAANVQVLDDSNFSRYRPTTPAVITPPPGRWHVAIDLGGAAGGVSASVSVL